MLSGVQSVGAPHLGVNQLQLADLIGRLGKGLVAVAEHGQTYGQYAVSHRLGVCPCAGVEEEEYLEVRDEEDGGPHPERQEEQANLETLHPGERWREGRRGGGGPLLLVLLLLGCPLHMLQGEAVVRLVDLEDIVDGRHANKQVQAHADPSHPLTEIHHSPYSSLECKTTWCGFEWREKNMQARRKREHNNHTIL